MSTFSSLLVPLDGSQASARGLDCAVWLAQRLAARLHVLTASDAERSPRDQLERLRVPERHWPRIELHQASGLPEKAIVGAVTRYGIRLVVMSARGDSLDRAGRPESEEILGHVARFVVERCAIPVLLIPPLYREELPWKRLIVPMSGAIACDDALAVAVQLASSLDLSVKVAHVANPGSADEGLDTRARYSDAIHHEYAGQLEELVRRALPLLDAKQRSRIEAVSLSSGDVLGRLTEIVGGEDGGAVVVGWQGTLASGHAGLLKALIRNVASPLLLVRKSMRQPSQLNTGEDFT